MCACVRVHVRVRVRVRVRVCLFNEVLVDLTVCNKPCVFPALNLAQLNSKQTYNGRKCPLITAGLI